MSANFSNAMRVYDPNVATAWDGELDRFTGYIIGQTSDEHPDLGYFEFFEVYDGHDISLAITPDIGFTMPAVELLIGQAGASGHNLQMKVYAGSVDPAYLLGSSQAIPVGELPAAGMTGASGGGYYAWATLAKTIFRLTPAVNLEAAGSYILNLSCDIPREWYLAGHDEWGGEIWEFIPSGMVGITVNAPGDGPWDKPAWAPALGTEILFGVPIALWGRRAWWAGI